LCSQEDAGRSADAQLFTLARRESSRREPSELDGTAGRLAVRGRIDITVKRYLAFRTAFALRNQARPVKTSSVLDELFSGVCSNRRSARRARASTQVIHVAGTNGKAQSCLP